MAKSQRFNSVRAPRPYGAYVHALCVGKWTFLSGQNGRDPATLKLVTGGIRQQTQQAIHNIESVLVDLGLTLAHIVRTTVYLRDMKDFVAMDEVYARFFGTELPAHSTIQAPLPFGALVALDAIANRTITIA